MLPFGMTIPATVPQKLEIPEGLMNYPVLNIHPLPQALQMHRCTLAHSRFLTPA